MSDFIMLLFKSMNLMTLCVTYMWFTLIFIVNLFNHAIMIFKDVSLQNDHADSNSWLGSGCWFYVINSFNFEIMLLN